MYVIKLSVLKWSTVSSVDKFVSNSALGNELFLCVGGPQDYPHIWKFTRWIHGTQHIVVLMGETYYSDIACKYNWIIREEAQVESGKARMWAYLGSLPFIRGHTEHILFPVIKMQPHAWDVSVQGSPLEI